MDYDEYLATFASGDDEALIARFFAPDCVMESASGSWHGHEGMRAFLAWAHDGIREVPRPQKVVQDADTIFAEIDMDFHALKERADFPFGPMRPGDCVTVKFLARYQLDAAGRVRVLKTMTWPPGKGVTRLPPLGAHPTQLAAYHAYSAAFSAGDPERYTRFYTQDVVLELPKVPPIRGRDAIAVFYAEMFTRVRESLTIHAFDATDERIVADTTSRFTALADAPDFVVGAMKAGEWIEVRVHVTYTLRDGLIDHIAVKRAGEPVLGRG